MQMIFEAVIGTYNVTAGYTGGTAAQANYPKVSTGTTNHAESVEIWFDPSQITYSQLLDVFFHVMDPTTLDYQGNDHGPQYRSAIWYANKGQKTQALGAKTLYQKDYLNPIVTEINPLPHFYPAEQYHQDYAKKNPNAPYIVYVEDPKFTAFKTTFPSLLKQDS